MRKISLTVIISLIFFSFIKAQDIEEILPHQAYQMLKNPKTHLIDVRSIAEYVFIGHPEMAYNIPLMFWSEKEQKLILNEKFIQDLESRFAKNDVLIFICRSGKRSLKAAKIAKQAGFLKVFSIKEGFEGEKDKKGYRTINGWKNRNLPYTYQLKKEFIYQK
ncbi:rhodanese-like domain-containing protein [Candidatus Aminicenantes bacterium AH-873-B07]|jgi:rhodanese-related sulfurtransferase|nr:rhodanese-like domain-containing protein [Candidatus Aminicenantes bacterium AH-873-B07]